MGVCVQLNCVVHAEKKDVLVEVKNSTGNYLFNHSTFVIGSSEEKYTLFKIDTKFIC